MLNFLLVLVLLSNIKSIRTGINEEKYEEEKQAIEIRIGYKVGYDKDRNYFQFKYEGSNEAKIFFDVDYSEINLNLIYPSKEKIYLKYEGFGSNYQTYMGNLTENGIYFIEVICKSYTCELGGSFNSFIIGDVMDTIDLSKNVYFKDKEIDFDGYNNDYYYGTIDYKVSNLNENKYVYFVTDPYDYKSYIPYYPDEPPSFDPYIEPLYNLTIFEVINIHNSNKTKKNVKIYEFKEGNEYIIRIHSLIYYKNYYDYARRYYYQRYFFSKYPIKTLKKLLEKKHQFLQKGL